MKNNPIMDFHAALERAGLRTDDPIIADGKLHRFHVSGDKPGTRNGWYVLHAEGIPAGAFGSWRTGAQHTWSSKPERAMTFGERAEFKRKMNEALEQRRLEQDKSRQAARERAKTIWRAAPLAKPDHPYLVSKRIKPHYSKTVPAETLMEVRGNRHPTELANLMGVRLAISNEIEEGEHWAEARLKSLTGDEMIAARFMRQDFFEFRKTHKHVIAGNHKPALRLVDEAIRRRLHLIPWSAKFDKGRRDREMPQKLRAEAGAILAWAIRGCQRWLNVSLNAPEIVRSATENYLSAQDTFAE
jgi:hypothetical protein